MNIREQSKKILANNVSRRQKLSVESKMKLSCTIRESNPGQVLGRHLCYHYTNGAVTAHTLQFGFKV